MPVGVFDGLTALTTLRLGSNAVEPLSLIVSLQQVGDGAFKAVIPTGAPFNIVLLVSVTNGSISGGLTSVTIPQGSVESATFTVISTSGTSTIPTVSIGALPRVPPNHFGYILAQSRVCNRTPQVASAIAAAVPSASGCGDVTEVDLATITTLNLNGMSIHSLKTDDFAGMLSLTTLYLANNQLTSLPDGLFDDLISLQALDLSGNELTSLPDSIFDGLISLRTLSLSNNELTSLPDSIFDGLVSLQALDLSGNRVAPLPLTVSLEQVGEKQFNARAPAGAPFDIVLPLNVTNGSINGGAMTLTIPAGSVESQRFTVTRTAGTTAAVTVDIGTLPNPPSLHEGYTLVKTDKFPLEVISRINSPPMFTEGTSTTRTVAENTDARVNIGAAVAATDVDSGTTLVYTLDGTDATSFDIKSTTGQLQTKAALDYETKNAYTVTLTVSDGGLTDTITVTLIVTDVDENRAPLFTEGDSTTRTVAENTPAAVNIGTAAAATDADDDTLTYSLGGTDAAAFSIDSSSGQLKTRAVLDYETQFSYSVTVSVFDGNGGSGSITVIISVTDINENHAPVLVSEISSVTLTVGGGSKVVDVSGNFSDPNEDTLSYTASSHDTDVATVSVDGSQINISPEGAGSTTVTVTASDGEFTATQTISVTVTAPKLGNRAPVAVGTIAVTLTEGGESEVVNVSSNFNDPDGDTLNYTLIMEHPYDPSVAVVAVHNTPGIFSIEPRGIGSTTVKVTASDEEFTATQTISITVTENQTPVLVSELPSRIFLEIDGESEVVDVSGNFSDPNGDSLVYTAQSSNTNVATVSVDGSQVRITPRRSGTDQIQAIAEITVTASDGQSSVSDTIEVWVTAPPAEDETAPPAENEVEEPVENEAPVAVGTIDPVTVSIKLTGHLTSVFKYFSDPNGDTLSYTANSHDTGVATVSVDGSVIKIFPESAGSTTVTVTASDGEFTATQTISVTVTAPKLGNRAPVAVGTIAVTLTEGGESEVVDVSSNFSDPDGDTLNYTLIMEHPYDPSVAVVAVHNTPGIYSVIPRGVGSTAVKIEVSDGEFTATQTISITVTGNQIPINGNQIPILLTALPSRIFLEINGASKVVDVSGNFSDPNGDSLIYTAQSSNTNVATVSVDGSQVRITPRRSGTDQIQAIAQITVTASDGQSSVSDTIEVWVTAPPAEDETAPPAENEVEEPVENEAPVAVGTIDPVTVSIKLTGHLVPLSKYFSDPNGDTLSYTASSHDTDVATVSVDGSQISISPEGAGSTTVTVTASDGEFTATQTISVTVTAPKPGNRAPVAVGTIAVTLTAGGRSEVVDVSSNFSDPDGDTLNYTLIMEHPYDPSVAVVAVHNTPGIYSVIPRGVGSTAVKIEVSDGEFTATQTISITVTENQTPVLVSELPSRIFLEIDGESEVVDVSGNFSDPNGDSLIYTAQSSNTNVATVSVDGSQVRITPRRSGTDQIQAIAQITVTASDGQSSVSDTIEVWVTAPLSTELLPNYPNPFNPETWIPYHLAKDSDIEITIYDALGTVIRRLELGHQSAGYYTSRSRAAYWNGRNTLGEQVPSGVYFYHLQADNVSLLRKMVILK